MLIKLLKEFFNSRCTKGWNCKQIEKKNGSFNAQATQKTQSKPKIEVDLACSEKRPPFQCYQLIAKMQFVMLQLLANWKMNNFTTKNNCQSKNQLNSGNKIGM